jgi:phospholipase/lecithinase/hemolysin
MMCNPASLGTAERKSDRSRWMFRGHKTVIAAGFAWVLGLIAAPASAFTQLVIFGDSLSDAGNVYASTFNVIPISPPYFSGRFSNGPVWVEQLASNLGLDAAPSLTGGTNQAWGGARTGAPGSVPALSEQAAAYIGGSGGSVDPGALYVVFGGGNDVRDATTLDDVEQSVSNIADIITDLASAGAVDFLVPNLPDIGKTPEAMAAGPAAMAGATALSVGFNAGLASILPSLEAALAINIIPLDVFAFLNGILDDPGSLGITNTSSPCVSGITVCDDPSQYIFWDSIHPTAVVHAALGDFASAIVPVPAALWLFASGLFVLAAARRRAN